MKYRIYIAKPEDRDAVVAILARNGYTVRQASEKSKTGSRTIHFIEYWEAKDERQS